MIGNPEVVRISSISEPSSGFHRAYPVLELLLRIDVLNVLFMRILCIRVDVIVRLVKAIARTHILCSGNRETRANVLECLHHLLSRHVASKEMGNLASPLLQLPVLIPAPILA